MDAVKDIDWVGLGGKVAAAIVILLVTWIIAKIVKWAFTKLTSKIKVLQKAGNDGDSIGQSLGSVAGLLVWLFGLIALLDLFGLSSVLTPIQGLLDGILGFLPNLIGAAFVFVVGALVAKIVRQLVETALGAVPFDKWLGSGSKLSGQVDQTVGVDAAGQPYEAPTDSPGPAAQIVKVIGLVLYAMIMIIVAIAALQILGISSISDPAEGMLNMIMAAIPKLIAAAILLGIGVVIAKFAADILGQIIDGLGFDNALRSMDVLPEGQSATPVITKIIQTGIVLFFAVMAAQMLEFPQITAFITQVLELGGKVIFGGAIIAAGVVIASVLAKLVPGSASQILKYATIVLFVAIGLKFMGLADSIINLGFGAVVVGGAAAAALAFGLGGRDAAAKQLNKLQAEGGGARAAAPSAPTTPPAGNNPPQTPGV
ncbi:putative transporter (transmembrane protein) [Nocardioides albertanoniae]|uniref:Putative transporter (Transmembrane protein) n=1 Tax=Nocardioides albertanoniae TaxID=1175486 RepID=A0A543A0P1_9ACTN|nr:mechanosensitive ion channel [Nocardioides albertanoniae]TQL66155.1 putative transporter (transmembrane protein) [Nocardioides albertanoniae]